MLRNVTNIGFPSSGRVRAKSPLSTLRKQAFRLLHEMRHASLCCCALMASLLPAINVANAQLRGHGGPVRALAVSPDGKSLMSGSFDTSAIRWSLERSAAEDVLRFHDGAVNAVVLLRDGRAATGGEDARIAIWSPGERTPRAVLEGHQARSEERRVGKGRRSQE